jgi:hypothetical protein
VLPFDFLHFSNCEQWVFPNFPFATEAIELFSSVLPPPLPEKHSRNLCKQTRDKIATKEEGKWRSHAKHNRKEAAAAASAAAASAAAASAAAVQEESPVSRDWDNKRAEINGVNRDRHNNASGRRGGGQWGERWEKGHQQQQCHPHIEQQQLQLPLTTLDRTQMTGCLNASAFSIATLFCAKASSAVATAIKRKPLSLLRPSSQSLFSGKEPWVTHSFTWTNQNLSWWPGPDRQLLIRYVIVSLQLGMKRKRLQSYSFVLREKAADKKCIGRPNASVRRH